MDECKNTPKIHYLHTSTPHQGNNGIAREEEKPHYRDRGKAAKRGFKPTDHRLNQQLVSSKAVAFQGPAAVMVAEKLGFGDGAGINSRGWWGRGRGNRTGQHHDFSNWKDSFCACHGSLSCIFFFLSNFSQLFDRFFFSLKNWNLQKNLLSRKIIPIIVMLKTPQAHQQIHQICSCFYIWRKRTFIFTSLNQIFYLV